jgi:hypothetical protein
MRIPTRTNGGMRMLRQRPRHMQKNFSILSQIVKLRTHPPSQQRLLISLKRKKVLTATTSLLNKLNLTQLGCLQSLSFADMETRQNTIARAISNTSTWIFERPEFLDWLGGRNLNEHKGLFWIKGKPGSGKSVMMKQMLMQLRISQSSSAIISFFFNAHGSPLEKRPLGLFRSLLHQLLRQRRHLFTSFLPKFQTKQDTLKPDWEWGEGELREYFSDVVTSAQVPSMIVFIDALDECERDSEMRRVVSFLAELASSAVLSGCRFYVCMSSRHFPQISVLGCLEITMESWNASDIFKYVQSKLCLQDTAGVDFQKDVRDKASGVFLWVVLVVSSLLKKKDEGGTVKDMRRILQSVPDELDALFTGCFRTVSGKDRQKTLKLMQWILFAERPLTPMEISCALAFSVDYPPKSQKSWQKSDHYSDDDAQIERILQILSKGLVEVKVDDNSGYGVSGNKVVRFRIQRRHVVQFIHESVRDFLLHHNGLQIIDPSLSQHAFGKSHDALTRACISYLSIEELQASLRTEELQIDQLSSKHEKREVASKAVSSYRQYIFWDYAVRSIFEHAARADSTGLDQRHLAIMFNWDGQRVFHAWRYFNHCLRVTDYRDIQGSRTVFLHIASESGLLTCVSDLLGWGIDIDIEGGRFKFALIAAASQGHEAVVRLLLEHGADIGAKGDDGRTALHEAAENGHEAVVWMLLEQGADVDAKSDDGRTALHEAAENGHEAVVRMLLEQGADVNAMNYYGWNGGTVLHEAASQGHASLMKMNPEAAFRWFAIVAIALLLIAPTLLVSSICPARRWRKLMAEAYVGVFKTLHAVGDAVARTVIRCITVSKTATASEGP